MVMYWELAKQWVKYLHLPFHPLTPHRWRYCRHLTEDEESPAELDEETHTARVKENIVGCNVVDGNDSDISDVYIPSSGGSSSSSNGSSVTNGQA